MYIAFALLAKNELLKPFFQNTHRVVIVHDWRPVCVLIQRSSPFVVGIREMREGNKLYKHGQIGTKRAD